MRLKKNDLFFIQEREFLKASTQSSSDDSNLESNKTIIERTRKEIDIADMWYKELLAPNLKPYLDIPETIELEESFVRELKSTWDFHLNGIDSNRSIEESEKKNRYIWNNSATNNESTSSFEASTIIFYGTLSQNYNLQHQEDLNDNQHASCIVIEMKPKAGYVTKSPLVNLHHRAKYKYTRFEIFQQLHFDGYITKRWSSSALEQKSSYNPLDLFSNQQERMKCSMEKLFACPQNNLRVSLRRCNRKTNSSTDDSSNFHVLYGHDKSSSSDIHRHALEEVLNVDKKNCNDSDDLSKLLESEIVGMMTVILKEEPFLFLLLKLQKLDWIDGDGAILIYDHLIQLCGNSQDKAEQILNSHCSLRQGKNRATGDTLGSSSPFCDHGSTKLFDFLTLITHTESELEKEDIHWETVNKYRNEAIREIKALGILDCTFLLQNWLLALAMCDLTFFVNISPTLERKGHKGNTRLLDMDCFSVIDKQRLNFPGTLQSKDGRVWHYIIKLIDCGQKPARKLQKRYKKEIAIRDYQTQ